MPVADASLVVGPGGSPLLLTLDDGGLEALAPGAHAADRPRVGARLAPRRRCASPLRLAPAVDAPAALLHDPATDLVLTGANLADAQEAVLWPDVGVTAPTDVHTLPVSAVAAGSVTVAVGAAWPPCPPRRGPWRLTIRIGDQVYTPYVLVELGP